MQVVGFDWDAGNRFKCQKHGLSTAAVESIFLGTVRVFPDPAHSGAEERFKAIGKDSSGKAVFIVFTLRLEQGDMLIRPISARYMHLKEIEYYEKSSSRSAE